MQTDEHTVNGNWEPFLKKIMGLWPNRYEAEMTPDLIALWRKVLGHSTYAAAVQQLEEWAAHERFFPKPGQILRRLTHSNRSDTLDDHSRLKQEEIEQMRQERTASWNDCRMTLKGIPRVYLEQHKKTLLAQDWRLKVFEERPITDRVWMAHISDRVKLGLAPEEIDDNRDVPDQYAQKGNLGETLRI